MRMILLTAGLILAGAAHAETFTYDLDGYPAAEASTADCRATARTIAAEFAASAGVEAIGICTAVRAADYDLQIRYEADERLSVVSTARSGTTMAGRGFFETLEACQAVLAEEAAVFTAQTGLSPLFTPYCYAEGGFDNDTPWMFRIDAAGDAAIQPRLESVILFGRILGHSRSTFFAEFLDGLSALGLEGRYLRLDSSLGYGYVTVFMYSEENHRLENENYAKLDSVEACEAELERFQAAAEGTDTIMTFCAAQHPTGRAEVTGLFLDALAFDAVESLDVFETYESCVAARAGVVARYRADGLEVVDGLCSINEDRQWFVNLLVP